MREAPEGWLFVDWTDNKGRVWRDTVTTQQAAALMHDPRVEAVRIL